MRLENIPNYIKKYHNFVVAKHNNKVPLNALYPYPASVEDSSSWSSYTNAYFNVMCGYSDYIGYVFNDNGIVGIDIDKCVDDKGNIDPDVYKLIQDIGSYTEYSKSKKGIHILVKANIAFKGRKIGKFELYKDKRYFILTGYKIGEYADIIANQKAVDKLITELFKLDNENTTNYYKEHIKFIDMHLKDTTVKFTYPLEIGQGQRNITLIKIGGTMANYDLDFEYIKYELEVINNRCCEIPLNKQEMRNVLSSTYKYYLKNKGDKDD